MIAIEVMFLAVPARYRHSISAILLGDTMSRSERATTQSWLEYFHRTTTFLIIDSHLVEKPSNRVCRDLYGMMSEPAQLL